MQNEAEKKLYELRLAELDLQKERNLLISEIHRNQVWKEKGYKTISEYCRREFDYDFEETRRILIHLGLIIPSENLKSDDFLVQNRINNLKKWRRDKALENGIAIYRVLSNRTLLQVAETNPKSLEELSGISGIGPRIIETFGSDLLKQCV